MICTRCHGPNLRRGQRWCHDCHAAFQRSWRKRTICTVRKNARGRTKHTPAVAGFLAAWVADRERVSSS